MNDYIQNTNELVAIKNLDGAFIRCSKTLFNYCGLSSEEEIIGLTNLDLPSYEYIEIYNKHDQDVLSGKIYISIEPSKDFKKINFYY